MKLAEPQRFLHGDYPAGTPCEAVPDEEAAEVLAAPLLRDMAATGEVRVVRLGGKLSIVEAAALDAEAA